MDSSSKKIWEHEHGSSEVGYDFAGREVRKGAYAQPGSRYGWNIDEILPRSHGGRAVIENQQITRMDTNSSRGDKVCFWLDGVSENERPCETCYQVKRVSRLTGDEKNRIADYGNRYADKKYCVLVKETIEFESEIVETSPENAKYTISSVFYDGADWIAVMSEKEPCAERVIIGSRFPEEDIKRSWDRNFVITNIACGAGQWVVVMKRGADWTGSQQYYRCDHWPDDEMQKLWKKYSVTELVCSEYEDRRYDEMWGDYRNVSFQDIVVLGSQYHDYQDQQIITGTRWPPEGMKKARDRGYAITRVFDAEGFDSRFGAVMSRGAHGSQKYWASAEWPGSKREGEKTSCIGRLWKEGYLITDFAWVNGLYVLVGSKGWGIRGQCLRWGTEFPLSDVIGLWHGNTK